MGYRCCMTHTLNAKRVYHEPFATLIHSFYIPIN